MRTGDWDGAAVRCRQALNLQPTNGMLHAYEGMCHYRKERYSEAEPCFRRACTLDPKLAEAAVKQAQCLEKLHRYKEAMDVVKEWLPHRPNDIALQALYDFLKTKYESEEHDKWELQKRMNVHVVQSFGTESA
jgi:tetratricopeptide (TPR) repeat protein